MQGTLRRILSRRRHASEAGAEGEGAAAQGAKPAASSPARPTTAPSAAAGEQERCLPASGSTPGVAEAVANAGNEAAVGSSSQVTGSGGEAARPEQPAAAQVKREPELAAGGQAGAAGSAGAAEPLVTAGPAPAGAGTAQGAVAAGEGSAAAARPENAGSLPAVGEQAVEAAGSSSPAAAKAKAEAPGSAAAPGGGSGSQQQEAEQRAAAEQPVPADSGVPQL